MRIELGKNRKERKYVLHKLRKKAPRRRLAVRLPAAACTARAADVHTAGAAAAKLRRTHAEFSDAAAVLRAAAGAIPGAATDYTRARCAEKLFRVSAVPYYGDPLFGEFAVSDHRKPVPAGSGVYRKSDLQQPAV